MTVSIHATIKELTPTAVARAMGLPISTIHRWMTDDRIPGRGASHEWRRRQFEDAIKSLKRSTPKKRRTA